MTSPRSPDGVPAGGSICDRLSDDAKVVPPLTSAARPQARRRQTVDPPRRPCCSGRARGAGRPRAPGPAARSGRSRKIAAHVEMPRRPSRSSGPRVDARERNGHRRHPLVEPSPVGDAVDRHAGGSLQALEQPADQRLLVVDDRGHPARASRRRSLPCSARGAHRRRHNRAPDVTQVVGRGERPGDPLRSSRCRSPNRSKAGRTLKAGSASGRRPCPSETPTCGPNRVGRAGEEVRVESLDVDRSVRRVVDRVDVGQGADLVGPGHDLADRVDRTDRVAGVAHATSFVRECTALIRCSRSSVTSSRWISTVWTVRPRSAAIARHGATFAS